jgi:hypothetical protein
MQGFAVRLARRINRAFGRKGRVFAERYHARSLTSPRSVRNSLVYVLLNWRKHGRRQDGLDPWSSARWFDGWEGRSPDAAESPLEKSQTWLLTTGWRRLGLLRTSERPAEERPDPYG